MLPKRIIISFFLFAAATGSLAAPQQHQESASSVPRSQESSASFFLGDLRYVYKVYQECATRELAPCLKLKLISAMDRAARAASSEISLTEGITFVKDPTSPALNEIRTEEEIEKTLPRTLGDKEDALNNIIFDKIGQFFDSHTLQVKLPSSTDLQRSFTEEARKKKKGQGMLLLPLILGGTLIPLALGALALLAGKALIVSKLALVLASIIGLKKLLSGGHHGHESGHEVQVVSGGHSGGWARAYDKPAAVVEDSQNMAYNAYAQKVR